MEASDPKNKANWIELFFSGLGVAVCMLLTILFWRGLAAFQSLWLLPGLYFMELTSASILCFVGYFLQFPGASTLSWMYSGVLLVFIVLASFTVGLFYTQVFLIFFGLSIYSTIRHRQNLPGKLGLFVLSMLVQLALMLFFVRFLA
jgi:hypothetical protein